MFQTRLKNLREASGYRSQQAFADAFGVAQSTVGGWEAGKREPNYETTIRLSKFFNVSIDYLLGNEHNLKQDECSKLFRQNLSIALEMIDTDAFLDVSEVEYDYRRLQHLSETTYPISLEEAFEASDLISESLDNLLREDYKEYLKTKEPTPVSEDGLDDMEKLLMWYVKNLSPDQKQMLLAQMQVMRKAQKESQSVSAQPLVDETVPEF